MYLYSSENSIIYTVSGKKSLHFFLNNFKKFKFTFIVFGAHYHYMLY